jgi:chorismate dehydratase
MDAAGYFKQAASPEQKGPAGVKGIGIVELLEFLPLVYGLQNKRIDHPFQLISAEPAESARRLKDGEVELCLIPSVEYARSKETWNIVPGIAITCPGSAMNVQLFFKRGLKDLKKVAVDRQAASAAVLLKILMQEKFMLNPEYLEMPAVNLESMLNKADAALITGDTALHCFQQNRNRLDLNEEWTDLTGSPFVYSFWAGRDFTITADDLRIIKKSFDLGSRNLEQICKTYAARAKVNWVFYHDFLSKNISYTFNDKEQAGLLEFYNYAFFFGYIDFIPDLHFYPL